MFPLPTTAASFPPSALDVMDIQFCAVPTVVHDAPASCETQTYPFFSTAASVVPSELDVIDVHD
jgi:hypothetical protein